MKSLRILIIIFSGALFGFGLSLSGMINPNKLLGFLDLFGDWDPSLAFVMIGALAVTTLTSRFILKRKKPMMADKFYVPTSTILDKKLISGAALFGIGWGLSGYCPGPAVATLVVDYRDPGLFLIGMLTGMLVFHIQTGKFDRLDSGTSSEEAI